MEVLLSRQEVVLQPGEIFDIHQSNLTYDFKILQ